MRIDTTYKTSQEIALIGKAGHAVAFTLDTLKKAIQGGERSAHKLDSLAEITLSELGAISAFKGYKPPFHSEAYPSTICVSVNYEVVHGLPHEDKVLQEGDLVSLDLGASINGWYADAAITVGVGKVDAESQKLIDAAVYGFKAGMKRAVAGKHIGDISAAIEKSVRGSGFRLAAELQGHGIGLTPHEEPGVPNVGKAGTGPKIQNGLVICIEPMVNAGVGAVFGGMPGIGDGWTIVTGDRRRSAHYEHTIAVTEKGPVILTQLQ